MTPSYYADGATWERNIARRNRISRAIGWIVAAVMTLVAIGALGVLVMLAPLKTYEPYMVVVDKTTGFVEVKRPMAEGPLTQDEAVTTFNVVRYIKARETYDPKALKDNFDLAELLATGEAARDLTEIYSPANPINPVKLYGSNTDVSVNIKSGHLSEQPHRARPVLDGREIADQCRPARLGGAGALPLHLDADAQRMALRQSARVPSCGIPARPGNRAFARNGRGAAMRTGYLAAGLAFVLSTGLAHAEALPRPGRIDSRVRDVVYNKDNVTAIDASYGTSTMIELEPDEKIETLALGNSLAWKVEPNRKGDVIFIKPVEKNAQSNLNVVTDKRIYSFLLRSNLRPSGEQIYAVRFRFPDNEASASLWAKAKERAAYPNLKALNIANANSDYGYKGSSVEQARGGVR